MPMHDSPKTSTTQGMPAHRYPVPAILDLPDRSWPSQRIEAAPIWCSVDLRDGNQALASPMGPEAKLRFFRGLVEMGFKEIEVGFPAASQAELDFVRRIIEQDLIPDDVTIQVLTQARSELIEATMDAIRGARRVVVHVYNSTSTLQRDVVFGMDQSQIVAIATDGVKRVRERCADMRETEVVLEYSPESFSGTEPDFAVEICQAVMEEWGASREKPVILNLPATVEMTTPNVYADQIEYFCRQLPERSHAIVSVHPHNDRGCAVAAAELAVMAGAERVEGTLFGNGERTGNVDLVTLALNLMTVGVDPGLDLSQIDDRVALFEACTGMPVHARHPYAGELVFTAFSGSHQDAIRKGLGAREARGQEVWEVPYLPVDPADLGRSYEAVIRINSQSGKGGIAYVMERDHGYVLPRGLQLEFSRKVQGRTDASGKELSSAEVVAAFVEEYQRPDGPVTLDDFSLERSASERKEATCEVVARIDCGGEATTARGSGQGPLAAFVAGLEACFGLPISLRDYSEHAQGAGSDALAAAYVEVEIAGSTHFGVGVNASILAASFEAVVAAVNRAGVVSARSGAVAGQGAGAEQIEGGEDLAVDERPSPRVVA